MNKEYREFSKKEKDWLKKFQSVMNSAPNTLFMFVGSGMVIYALDENNKRYLNGDSVDSYATSFDVTTKMSYDGGDY